MTSTMTKPVYELGVLDATDQIRSGELSPVDLLDGVLRRIGAIDPAVKAWCYIDADRAKAEAAAMAEEAKRGQFRGPLHGLPVALKDVFDAEGMPTISNSKATDREPVGYDSIVAEKFKAAGAIVLGKVTTVEFAGAGNWTETGNPWNLAHTPGGSSSGSGAAVGARMIPAAIGTQTGGSNLRPAAYCGVTGFKGTYGRIGRTGCIAVSWSMDHPGVIARSVADCAAIFSAVAGPHPSDPTLLNDPPPPATVAQIGPPTIGVVADWFKQRSEPAMWAAVEACAAAYEKAGAKIVEITLPKLFSVVSEAHHLSLGAESAVVHAKRYSERAADFSPRHLDGFQSKSLIPATYYLQAQRLRRAIRDDCMALFDAVDVLIMPTAPGAAPFGHNGTGDASLLSPWSFTGFPAASISAGLSPEGLPMGLQIVGAALADQRVFEVAQWCEGITGILPAPADPS
jgi:aspartyl-tRNA(Asn)/glutamyl-tRNA(Gln) amidotransferase subunit A